MNIRPDAFLLNETISEIIQSIVYTTSQKFEKGVFTPKTHQIISGFKTFLVHTYRIRCGFVIFHSRERILKHPDSPNVCGRKPYPERKSCGFKNIGLRLNFEERSLRKDSFYVSIYEFVIIPYIIRLLHLLWILT